MPDPPPEGSRESVRPKSYKTSLREFFLHGIPGARAAGPVLTDDREERDQDEQTTLDCRKRAQQCLPLTCCSAFLTL